MTYNSGIVGTSLHHTRLLKGELRFRKAICYHESGHAVIASQKGKIYGVAVVVEAGCGVTRYDLPDLTNKDRIKLCLAGCMAEAIYLKTSFNKRLRNGKKDLEVAYKLAKEEYHNKNCFLKDKYSKADDMLAEAIREIKKDLLHCWPAVRSVSNALFHHAVLNGDDINKRILESRKFC